MFLKILNEKLEKFITDSSNLKYTKKLDEIEKMCYEVLNEKDVIIETDEWSRKIDISETIDIIYEFLLTIDKELASQYKNIISCVDENNEPLFIVKEKSSTKYPINGVLKTGKIKFYYENTINDLFSIMHETAHLFNRSIIEDENNNLIETELRSEYTEAISIISEYLLGEYLVSNNIITQNDFNKRKAFRMENEKYCAKSSIVQCELIRRFINSGSITENDLDAIFIKFKGDHSFLNFIEVIVFGLGINLPNDLKYVKAVLVAKKILSSKTSIKDFVNLNHVIGNINSTYEDVNKIVR